MNTPTPDAPADPDSGSKTGPETGHDTGPRVTRDELRNLAGLRRSRSDSKIAGVAGGISRHLDIDPLITRVVLVVLVFFGGAGVIVYAACWLLVPLDGNATAAVRLDDRSRTFALTFVGVIAALALLGDSLGGWGFPWPLAIIGTVIVLVLLFRGRHEQVPPPWPTQAAQPTQPGEAAHAAGHEQTHDPHAYIPAPPQPVRSKRRGPLLFWYTAAFIAIGVGVLGSIDLAGVSVAESAYPALALITCGAMLVVGAFWGRPGGLILLGLVSAVATAAVATIGELDTGRLAPTPTTSTALLSDYDLDVGEIVLDLRDITDPENLDGRAIDVEVGLGRVEVIVPDDLDLTVTYDLGAGDSTVFGTSGDGGTATTSVDGGTDAPALTLDVTVGLGELEITREGDS